MDELVIPLPRRLSVRPLDKGYQVPSRCERFIVLFNGKVINNVVTADVDKGYVVRMKVDVKGNGRVKKTEYTCKGKVEIVEKTE